VIAVRADQKNWVVVMWERKGEGKLQALHDFNRSYVAAISMWETRLGMMSGEGRIDMVKKPIQPCEEKPQPNDGRRFE